MASGEEPLWPHELPSALHFRLDLHSTPRFGCVCLRNSYDLRATAFDVHFFRQSLNGSSASQNVNFQELEEWERFQATIKKPLPLLGLYFPFEGPPLYGAMQKLGWGSAGLTDQIPRYLKTVRTAGFLTQVGIPSSMLVYMLLEFLPSKDLQVDTWVPHASIGERKTGAGGEERAVRLAVSAPEVQNEAGVKGELSFGRGAAGGYFARVRRAAAYGDNERSLEDFLYDVNVLNFRIWPLIPMALLLNPSDEPDLLRWRNKNLEISRRVARAQQTALLGVGVSPFAYNAFKSIPDDVLPVTVPGSEDNAASGWIMSS